MFQHQSTDHRESVQRACRSFTEELTDFRGTPPLPTPTNSISHFTNDQGGLLEMLPPKVYLDTVPSETGHLRNRWATTNKTGKDLTIFVDLMLLCILLTPEGQPFEMKIFSCRRQYSASLYPWPGYLSITVMTELNTHQLRGEQKVLHCNMPNIYIASLCSLNRFWLNNEQTVLQTPMRIPKL